MKKTAPAMKAPLNPRAK
jgi:hypothetical protein